MAANLSGSGSYNNEQSTAIRTILTLAFVQGGAIQMS